MIAATAATACLLLGTTILSGAVGLGFSTITLFHAILGDFVEAFFASVADAIELFEPQFCVFLLIVGRLKEEGSYLLKTFFFCPVG